MKLSFIVAAYNVEAYIQDCLKSILNLNLKFHYEIIVINDGSCDNTLCKITELSDKKIRIINIENSGISHVRNLGIKEALGEYIYFVDGDDLINKYDFELFSEKLNSNYDVLIGNFNFIDASNNIIVNTEENINIISNGKNILKQYFLKTITPSVWKCFFKVNILKSNNILFLKDIIVAEDGEWFIRVLYISNNVYFNNSLKVYNYRLRNGSVMMSNYSCRKFRDTLIVIEELQKTIQKNKIEKEDRGIFDLYSISLLFTSIMMFKEKLSNQEVLKIKSISHNIKHTSLKNFIFLSFMRINVKLSILIFKKIFYFRNYLK